MRFTLPRESYIPKTYEAKITPKDLDNVVIYFERGEKTGRICAMAFFGKRAKPVFNYSFGTGEKGEQRRAEYVAEWVKSMREIRDRKAAAAAERKAFQHTLQVGDILKASWGYDQTNIDFYQVVELRGKSNVVIREIGQEHGSATGPDSWITMPRRDSFHGEPMVKRVQQGNSVRIASYANAYPWNGKAAHASTGH